MYTLTRSSHGVLAFTAAAVLFTAAPALAARAPKDQAQDTAQDSGKAAKAPGPMSKVRAAGRKAMYYGLGVPLQKMVYYSPSTLMRRAGGYVEQQAYHDMRDGKGGKGKLRVSKMIKAASVPTVVAERLALISLFPGGADALDLPSTVQHLVDNPVTAGLVVTANVAFWPMTKNAYKRAVVTGSLDAIAKRYGTTRQDVDTVMKVAKELDLNNGESWDFFNMLHEQVQVARGKGDNSATIGQLAQLDYAARTAGKASEARGTGPAAPGTN